MTAAESDGPIAGRLRLRTLLLATTGLLFLTVVMGISARATASGLACNANWPLCDGGLLNLFPATLPSFFEWFHRVVAGIAGLFAVASAVLVWRRDVSPLLRWGVTVGAVLIPVQVLLGRETVVSFVPEVLAAHYWTAMAIYGAFTVATVEAWRDALGRRHALVGLGIGLVSVPFVVVLGPPVVIPTPPIEFTRYVFVLAGFSGLVLAAMVTWRDVESSRRYLVSAAVVLFPLVVFFGRQRIVTPEVPFDVAHEVAAVLLFLTVAVRLGLDLRAGEDRPSAARTR